MSSAKCVAQIKPGMRDSDVTALAQYEGQLLGSEQGIFLGMSAEIGKPSVFRAEDIFKAEPSARAIIFPCSSKIMALADFIPNWPERLFSEKHRRN